MSTPAALAEALAAESSGEAAGAPLLRAGRGFDLCAEVLGPRTWDEDWAAEPLAADIGRAALAARAQGAALLPVTPLYLREPDAAPLRP